MKLVKLLRSILVPFLVLTLLAVSGCGFKIPSVHPTGSSSPGTEATAASDFPAPNLPAGNPSSQGAASPDATGNSQPSPVKSSLYDPSIFVIEASGTWKQELAPGYFAEYECELYIDKVDSNDNRSASGMYTGVFWMKTTLDAEEFISDMLENVPINMNFNAGGEGICDNVTMNLLDGYVRDPLENFDIPVTDGEPISPGKDALADSGGFVVSASAYLSADAQGAQGENLNYQDEKTTDTDVRYIIHVAPDPTSTATERKVTIYLTTDGGAPVTLEGTWHRLPGYPEDVLEYANSGKQNEILEKHGQ